MCFVPSHSQTAVDCLNSHPVSRKLVFVYRIHSNIQGDNINLLCKTPEDASSQSDVVLYVIIKSY
jgi:hypothetical protein